MKVLSWEVVKLNMRESSNEKKVTFSSLKDVSSVGQHVFDVV